MIYGDALWKAKMYVVLLFAKKTKAGYVVNDMPCLALDLCPHGCVWPCGYLLLFPKCFYCLSECIDLGL